MFMYLRKNKKGFTLIELMVVVAIIGVLALLGLRLYTGQQAKAKEAIVKANAGTVQTLIQAELADGSLSNYASIVSDIDSNAGMQNPFNSGGTVCATNDTDLSGSTSATGSAGVVYVFEADTTNQDEYYIRGYGQNDWLPDNLIAKK